MWKFDTAVLVKASIFSAIVIALQISGLGSIPVPNLSGSMTTLIIPVILATVLCGPVVGLIAGTVMGFLYLVLPATASFGPIVLIPPRIFMVICAWFSYKYAHKFLPKNISIILASGLAALTNTATAVGIAIILQLVQPSIVLAVLPQAIIELVGSMFLVPIIYRALYSAAPNLAID
jgi:uncharacterized membrane protein